MKFWHMIGVLVTIALGLGSCSSSSGPGNTGNPNAAIDRIVFGRTDMTLHPQEVYAMNPNATGKTVLLNNAYAWSAPRGNLVVLLQQLRSDTAQFFASDLWGMQVKPLLKVGGLVSYYVLSPDGQSLLYGYKGTDGYSRVKIYTIALGTERTILDSGDYFPQEYPQFSPDSRRLAFLYRVGSTTLAWMDIGDSVKHQFAANAVLFTAYSTGEVSSYAWTPNGNAIMYQSQSQANPQMAGLRSYEVASGTETQLLADSIGFGYPTISPDGRYVAYSSPFVVPNAKIKLGVLDLNTMISTMYDVPYSLPYGTIGWMDWSADSKLLLFGTYDQDPALQQFKYSMHAFDPGTASFKPSAFPDSVFGRFYWGRGISSP